MIRQADIAIKVDHITKTFRIPTEPSSGVKQKLINILKRKKGYREFTPLNDVSFEIREGEFFGIVGRNGSGKSTLLKTIANIYSPTKGSSHVKGSLIPFIELGVGFNPELTGRENVFLNGALLGFSRPEMEAMYDEIVEFAEIGDFMEEKLKNYSSGMQVRLGFSIAIKAQGDVLLLDEVLAVGDSAFQQKCFTYFEQLKKEKRTIVLVTHDMSSVTRFCTRAVYLEKGKIIADGTPEDISDIYKLRNIESVEAEAEKEELRKETPGLDNSFEISSKLYNQNDDGLSMKIAVKSNSEDSLYLGISIFKDGISVAEMNSKDSVVLKKNGKISLSIGTSIFNPGVYEITTALFTLDNRQLVAIPKDRIHFVVKGNDETRAGAIKLDDTWEKI